MIALRLAPFKVSARQALSRSFRSQPFRGAQRRQVSSDPQISSQAVRPQRSNQPPIETLAESNEVAPLDIPSQLWYMRLGPVTHFFGWFSRTQRERPYSVQICTSLAIYLFGDLVAQDIGGEEYDSKRTLRMLVIGSVGAIPGYRWFLFLGNHFNYASKVWSVAAKVVVQQIVFTPIFNTYFFAMQAILTGQPPSGVIHRVQEVVPTSIANSAKFWPTVTALSFTFIQPQYRFMFSGAFAVVWQSYLSFLNRRAEKTAIADPMVAVA